MSVPTDGKGFWVGKKSLQNWRRLAKVALEDRIVAEVQDWQLHNSSPRVRLYNHCIQCCGSGSAGSVSFPWIRITSCES